MGVSLPVLMCFIPLRSIPLNQAFVVLVNEQMAKAAEHEEDSKKKIVALEKEIARVQEQKVIPLTPEHPGSHLD